MARTLTRPVDLHGEHMPEGAKVLLLLGSANRDERVWDRPDEFDIDRTSSVQHVGFGHGIHVCLGAALARLEMRVSLEEIFRAHARLRDRRSGMHARALRQRARLGDGADPLHAVTDVASDVDEITALIHEYAFRLDAGDLDGVAALFEHAELGSTQHDRRLRGTARGAHRTTTSVIIYDDGTPQTQHQITNVTVQVDGDHATSPQLLHGARRDRPGTPPDPRRATTSTVSSGSTACGGSPSASSTPGWSATCRATCDRTGSCCKETGPPGVVHPMETVAMPGPGDEAGLTPAAPEDAVARLRGALSRRAPPHAAARSAADVVDRGRAGRRAGLVRSPLSPGRRCTRSERLPLSNRRERLPVAPPANRSRAAGASSARATASTRSSCSAPTSCRTRSRRCPTASAAALVLRFYADCSEAETAEVLGCRPGTVGSLVHRGLAQLKKVIEL